MLEQIIFWTLGIILIVSALSAVIVRSPINSIIFLLVAMFALAGFYILMGAYIVALFQIIIYIGAIIVLFLFVVMLLNLKDIRQKLLINFRTIIFSTLAIVMLIGITCFFWYALQISLPAAGYHVFAAPASVKDIAMELFSRHLLALELTSVLLLAGAVGALLISRK